MKTTARIELPTGIVLDQVPALIDHERSKGTGTLKITKVDKTERSVVVEFDVNLDLELVYGQRGKRHLDSPTTGVSVGFKREREDDA